LSGNTVRSIVIAIAVLILLISLPGVAPSIQGRLFCFPVAVASSFFLGSPAEAMEDGSYLIDAGGVPVSVAGSCSAFNYFVLLSTLLTGTCAYYFTAARVMRNVFPLLFLSYVISVAANTVRVIASVYAYKACGALLPGNYGHALHMSVGAVVFLTVTIMSFAVFERRFSGGDR